VACVAGSGVVSERADSSACMDDEREDLRVERSGETWVLAGDGFDGVELVNEFLGYLVDRSAVDGACLRL
jgi:hypothetical protein